MSRYRTSPYAPFLLLGLVYLAASASIADAQRWPPREAASSMDTTYRFQSNGIVEAEQVAGDITVTTWDRPEVRVRAWAEKGRVIADLSSNRVSLRVEGARTARGGQDIGDSSFELTVPVGTRVRARSVSGNVDVRGTRSEVEASSVSGDIEVMDAMGITTATSVSGEVRVERVRGDLSMKSVSGNVSARDVEGDVRAASVSGEVTLDGLTSRMVNARSTSGNIEFSGAIGGDGRYEFTSHSGDVTLILPPEAGADVSTRTFSGRLDSSFPITLGDSNGRRRRDTRTMDLTLGGGGGRISVRTFSGDVDIRGTLGRDRR